MRVDTHGFTGYKVPAAYDSLLTKVITWAPDRARAIARMRGALAEFAVDGPGRPAAGVLTSLYPAFACQ